MTNARVHSKDTLFILTRCGILAAMAVILYYVEIPVVAFYKIDLSTLPAVLAGFAMGPVPGMAVVVIKNLVHMLGTSTACVGEFADIVMSGCFVVPASLIYRRAKNRRSAVISMAVGTGLMTVAGVLVNYFVLIPAYQVLMGMPLEAIVGMGQAVFGFIDNTVKLVIFITAPFNLFKGVVLSVTTYLLYKRVSPLLHRRGGR